MKALVALLILTLGGLVEGQTTPELMEQLKAAVRREAKAEPASDMSLKRSPSLRWADVLLQLEDPGRAPETGIAWAAVLSEIDLLSGSEQLTALSRALSARLRAEKAEQERGLLEEMRRGFAGAFRAWLTLPSSQLQKMDPLIESVDQLVAKSNAVAPRDHQLQEMSILGRQLSEFMRDWQKYKAGVATMERSNQLWKELLDSPTGFSTLIPRSEILAGMVTPRTKKWTTSEQAARTREILAGIHNLAEIPAALTKLEELSKIRLDGPVSDTLHDAFMSLRSYQSLRQEEEEGRATITQWREIVTNEAAISDVTSALRNELLLSFLPRRLEVAEVIPPRSRENAAVYLHRVADTARQKSDWKLLARTVTLATELQIDTAFMARERAAMDLILGGLNQERARQSALAVCSFESALKTGAQLLPVEFIGRHLQSIREERPDEFQHGAEFALKAPAPVVHISDSRGSPMVYMGDSLYDRRALDGVLTVPPAGPHSPTSPP